MNLKYRRKGRVTALTFTKPMAADFSRKHCRQRSRPYLRMRPAWCAHNRLGIVSTGMDILIITTYHWRLPFPNFLGRENQTASCVIFYEGRVIETMTMIRKMSVPIQEPALRFKVRFKVSRCPCIRSQYIVGLQCNMVLPYSYRHDRQPSLPCWPHPTRYSRPICGFNDNNKDMYYRTHHSSVLRRAQVVAEYNLYTII